MNNLIIGDTSQLSYFFPKKYERISSRNIDYNNFNDKKYDRILICFAEQRTFIEDNIDIFIHTNVNYTISIIDFFKDKCNKLIIYSTSELWNNINGTIDLNTPYNYNYSHYIESKKILCEYIINKRLNNEYNNIIILYPVNFNTPYRKEGFLFSKIFNSIINKTKIQIGDTYFYRDIIHPKLIIERSLLAIEDEIIGSGRLIYINDFIKDLYKSNGLNYNDYVNENYDLNLKIKRNIYYLKSNTCLLSYKKLIQYTNNDIKKFKKNIIS